MKYALEENSSPLFPSKKTNPVQQIVGTLLYYSIAVDPTMLAALGSIASQQAKGMEKTYANTLWLLNYSTTHPTTRYGTPPGTWSSTYTATHPTSLNLEPASALVGIASW